VEARLIRSQETRPLPTDAVAEAVAGDDGIVWLDFDHAEEAAMAMLTTLVQVYPADLQDCYTRTPVPKIHLYPDHLFSAINGVARGDDGRLHFQPLKVFMNGRLVATVLGPTHLALSAAAAHRELDAIATRIDGGALRPASPLELVTAIRFQMLQAQEELTGSAARRIALLEQRIMVTDPVRADGLLTDLVDVRHDLQTIGTNAAQTYESYVQLIETVGAQKGLLPLDLSRLNELRQGFSHLKNTTDLEREYLTEMLDLVQTRASTELNRFVRKITAWGTIGIAWTVIAGIYGMNFAHMPELAWRYGYPGALGLMAVVGAVLAGLFHRQGWL
jgi:Mg2+ and Co2+ transporter CorA